MTGECVMFGRLANPRAEFLAVGNGNDYCQDKILQNRIIINKQKNSKMKEPHSLMIIVIFHTLVACKLKMNNTSCISIPSMFTLANHKSIGS